MHKPLLWQIPEADASTLRGLPAKNEILYARLRDIARQHRHVCFANSLAVEDMVLHHAIAVTGVSVRVFTLETGRLNRETLDVLQAAATRFPDIPLHIYRPDPEAAAAYDQTHGRHAMYESVDLRRLCCKIRKTDPLEHALKGADAWLTGQRREQSSTRSELAFAETDESRGIAKYNPLFDWRETDVWAYVRTFRLPENALYAQGCPSIGCEPCTMPVKAGDDIRAGRWWWEQRDSKECGLHR